MTLMFVDVASLQSIRAAEGAKIGRVFLEKCISLINVVLKKHEGELIRTVGGTVLCAFADTDKALDAAKIMHSTMEKVAFGTKTKAFLRMGLHVGEVVLTEGGCSGEVVTTTARMVTTAKPGQTVATQTVREKSSETNKSLFAVLPNAENMESRLGVKLFQVGATPVTSKADDAEKEPATATTPPSGPRKRASSSKKTAVKPLHLAASAPATTSKPDKKNLHDAQLFCKKLRKNNRRKKLNRRVPQPSLLRPRERQLKSQPRNRIVIPAFSSALFGWTKFST